MCFVLMQDDARPRPKDPWPRVLSLPERFVGDPASLARENIPYNIMYYRVPNTFPESNSMIFPWFSMTLASFFHDWHATTMTNFNIDKTHYCALNVVSLYLLIMLIATSNTQNKSCNSYNSLNNVFDRMECAERQTFFPWFFNMDILKFHDFSMILAFFPNSMIFPGLENAFLIFQVFHDFPGRWEPCLRGQTGHKNKQIFNSCDRS